MTVVQPNSIAGINSITVASGEGLSVHKADGSLIREIVAATGVGTFYAISVGTAGTISNTGNAALAGIITASAADLQTGPFNVGTAATFNDAGLKVNTIFKLAEGRPNAIDLLKNNEIQLVINTPSGQTPREDEIKIRTTAVYTNTPIITTIGSAKAALDGITALKEKGYGVKPLQEFL